MVRVALDIALAHREDWHLIKHLRFDGQCGRARSAAPTSRAPLPLCKMFTILSQRNKKCTIFPALRGRSVLSPDGPRRPWVADAVPRLSDSFRCYSAGEGLGDHGAGRWASAPGRRKSRSPQSDGGLRVDLADGSHPHAAAL